MRHKFVMSTISTFLTSLYDGTSSEAAAQTANESSDSTRQWRQIGSKNKLSLKPCRRIYSSAGKRGDIALYYVHGNFYAINATCPHMGGPLDVIVDLEELLDMPVPHAMCPWHLYAYNLTTGSSPQGIKAVTYSVKVENGYVYVLHETELSTRPYETDID